MSSRLFPGVFMDAIARSACFYSVLWCVALAGVAAAHAQPVSDGFKEFKSRVDDYAALHKRLEATLPKLSNEATPEQIDRNQRGLAALIMAERSKARQGDVFTPASRVELTRVLTKVFATMDRQKLRATILDEDPGPRNVRLTANGRYPDAVPLASMPLELLQALPPLPEELEYRFVGEALILLDPHAHIVVDFMTNALPK
jgi:hypothetical protein